MTENHEGSQELYIGIDAGSVSINGIVINKNRQIVFESPYVRHLGKVRQFTSNLIRDLLDQFGEDRIKSVSFTGNHGKNISEEFNLFYEFETISQVLGAVQICPGIKTIISMGGQDTALLQVDYFKNEWELEHFKTNGPCASGTGSFIDQQAQRLATSIYTDNIDKSHLQSDDILIDFIRLGEKSDQPSNVACRCTVFTKSDMIHLQNKGERLEDIIYGLHVGNARNYISTIISDRVVESPVIFIGGLSLNRLQLKAFKNYFPDLLVPEYNTSIGALGVAIRAMEMGNQSYPDPDKLEGFSELQSIDVPTSAKLELKETDFPENNEIFLKHIKKNEKVFLGIDIGSTTTKYSLINEKNDIISKNYIHTRGKPIEVAQTLLKNILDDFESRVDILGVATTGSGRNVVGEFLNADLIIDEITAHAKGAISIDKNIDTIFEIGGQDSKYIFISNAYPLDFDMNKVCAAGTGSFLHELANKYGINIVKEFQEIAMSAETPVKLAERCTVFMESDLVSYLQKGVEQKNLIAGLCYAIVHNYLNRVVGKRRIGKHVMFLGGPSLNKGVVAAFENVLGRGVIVPKHREVLGAYGAALLVKEKMKSEGLNESRFRGLADAVNDTMEYKEKVCKADKTCYNQCKLKVYNFSGRKSIWGGECGRYEVSSLKTNNTDNYFKVREKLFDKYLSDVCSPVPDDGLMEIDFRPTIGMQRSLYAFQTSVLWANFFDYLGFRLVLSKPTDSQISKAGIETMTAETCYPVKVSHGHIKELIGKTQYLFMPSIINMPVPDKNETGYYCPMIQSNSYMIQAAMDLGMEKQFILNPVLHMKNDFTTLANQLSDQLKNSLDTSASKIKKALKYGLKKQEQFDQDLFLRGKRIIEAHNPDEPLLVVSGRPYNLYDEKLNLRLGQNLVKLGIKAIPIDFINLSGVSLDDFPSMYWGLGANILRAAKIIKSNENYFGLHLTNFSCGPDSFIEHFFKYIMDTKPYLILELDEHSAVAGVMTRLEAFKNVYENYSDRLRESTDKSTGDLAN